MRKVIVGFLVAGIMIGYGLPTYSSDWDKVGKAAAVTEGFRILTGGKVDILGNIVGIPKRSSGGAYEDDYRYEAKRDHRRSKQVWVPQIVWKKKYISRHREYSEKYGEIIVEGHYIRYQVEEGGRWEWVPKRHPVHSRHYGR